jgi:hypothetical protein
MKVQAVVINHQCQLNQIDSMWNSQRLTIPGRDDNGREPLAGTECRDNERRKKEARCKTPIAAALSL